MADYEARLERLEQQSSCKNEEFALIYYHDGDERPYDSIEYHETYGGDARLLTRRDGEPVSELERRARSTWGLTGKQLLRVHFVGRNLGTGKRFTDAEYEAVGASGAHTINNSVTA